MSKPKTIYLHIGTKKTGSTAIRVFLYQNRELLEKNNFSYPLIKDNQYAKEQPLSEIVMEIENKGVKQRKTFEEVKKDWNNKLLPVIEESKVDNFIISSEELAETDLEFYDFLISQGFNVKVIVYIRTPSEYLSSLFVENYKSPNKFLVPTIMDFFKLSKKYNAYNRILNNIKRIGTENMIVRPYEKKQWKNESILEDFLNCIGLELSSDFSLPTEDQNISPDFNYVYLCKFINQLDLNASILYKLKKLLLKIHVNDSSLSAINSLSDEDIEKITNYFLPEINQIANFAGLDKMFLNIMPSCYNNPKKDLGKITFSKKQLRLLNYAIKLSKLNTPFKKFLYIKKKYRFFNRRFLSTILFK